MRTLSSFAVILVALAASQADDKAPNSPKDKPPITIEGNYILQFVSNSAEGMALAPFPKARAAPAPKGGGGPAPKGGGALAMRATGASSALVGPAKITKTEIVLEGLGGNTTMEYALDLTKSPAAIDVETVNVRGKKSKSLGIVEVSGKSLIIALAKEGEERPKTTEEAEGVKVYYFQKAPPPPLTEFRIVAMTVGREDTAEKELNKLAQDGFELVTTTQGVAPDSKSAVTTIHFIFKRTVKQP